MSTGKEQEDGDRDHDHDDLIENPDPHFDPIVSLPPVQTKTLEEDEEEMLKLRAKLFRYDNTSDPKEWKERGTGDVKILRHKLLGTCRVLMRRDKTLKICANHYVLPQLELKPNCGSDRAWLWSTPADFADEEQKSELLAIRFANAENAQKFREVFEDAKKRMTKRLQNDSSVKDRHDGDQKTEAVSPSKEGDEEEKPKAVDSVSEQLEKLNVGAESEETKQSDTQNAGDAVVSSASS